MIKVIDNNIKGLKLQLSDGTIIFLNEQQKDLKISAEPSTVVCWKGNNFDNSIKVEDVDLKIRTGQSIIKFYELDDLLDGKQN